MERPRRTNFPTEYNDHESPPRGSNLVCPERAKMTADRDLRKRWGVGQRRRQRSNHIVLWGTMTMSSDFIVRTMGSHEDLTGKTKSWGLLCRLKEEGMSGSTETR